MANTYHAQSLRQVLEELDVHPDRGLSREEAARAGIVTFNAGDLSSSQVADVLAGAGIAVRGGLHCAPEAHRFLGTLRRGAVRASVGWANTFEDIDALVAAVKALL